jgi:hypothetical protein
MVLTCGKTDGFEDSRVLARAVHFLLHDLPRHDVLDHWYRCCNGLPILQRQQFLPDFLPILPVGSHNDGHGVLVVRVFHAFYHGYW